ncbi:hypothetical protein SAMN04489834_2735 [Microterricola viridarii]|uniref:Uncharacterized protein n=1 Tax=Microterricola viridarii TaxID=412690 RepID=A0A1H1XBI6_9MICO|nr:hypothetical protein SAMN04489834_2735 [Microterricola viridarii]
MKFLGLGVINRDYEAPPAFEWNAHNDQAPFLYRFHRSVSGPRLHGCHGFPFRGKSVLIIS